MKTTKLMLSLIMAATTFLALPGASFAADNAAIEAMEAYFDFSEYEGATILPEQIPAEEWKNIVVIDTRDADQFQKSHIPGAINIDWRKLLARRNELPDNKMVLVYCNAGTLSSQAGLALRVGGMDNVRILQGGYNEWKAKGGFEANKIATRKAKK